MSIKPIDIQHVYNKSPEVAKVKGDEVSKNITNLQYDEKKTKETAEKTVNRVKSQEEIQKASIREKQDKNEQNSNKKKKGKEKDDKNDNPESGGCIDIKV